MTPWTVAYQAPPSMGFIRQEYWSGLPFPSPGDLPDLGIEPRSPAFQADSLTSEPPGKPKSHLLSHEGDSNFQPHLRSITLGLRRLFSNFIKHQLLSIALNSVSKFQVRVLPTILEYKEKFGKYPTALTFSMAALIAFYRTDKANDGEEIMKFMKTASVSEILKREDYWQNDLTDMIPLVEEYYNLIEEKGMAEAYKAVLN